MPAIELESGSCVVIEVPEFPVANTVAVLALCTQPAPVHIVFLVAGVAVRRRLVLIQPSRMATFAGRCAMFAEEGEFGVSIMIEGDRFPLLLAMAFLALRSEVGSMNVVLLMTGIAVGRCLIPVKCAFMAPVAFGLPVVALQPKCGIPIMLKE